MHQGYEEVLFSNSSDGKPRYQVSLPPKHDTTITAVAVHILLKILIHMYSYIVGSVDELEHTYNTQQLK